jgi:hypothetical protein
MGKQGFAEARRADEVTNEAAEEELGRLCGGDTRGRNQTPPFYGKNQSSCVFARRNE